MNMTRLSFLYVSPPEPLTQGRAAQKRHPTKKQKNEVCFYPPRYASVPAYCWLTS